MRMTKLEKELLFDLLDCVTDRCTSMRIDDFMNDRDRAVFWGLFKKLRLELKGY